MEAENFTAQGLAVAIIVFSCFLWYVHIQAIIYGKWKFREKSMAILTEDLLSVSIIKPLLGIDDNLFNNLETFFTQKYPKFEILFCVQSEYDSAIIVVKSLIEKYPNVDAKLLIGFKEVGVNPKINNMMKGYEASQYDLIMISDSGIKMAEDTLLDMASYMTDKVGLVHQMPYSCNRGKFGSHVEKIHFGTQHAKLYLTGEIFEILCATGMSSLMRKEIIEEAGGLQIFGQYLAEDYFLSKYIRDRGWKLCISSQTAKQNSSHCSLSHLHSRLIRWTKLRSAMIPSSIILEPLAQSMVQGSLISWAVYFLFAWDPFVYFLSHLLFWFLLDYVLLRVIQNGPLPFSKLEFLVGWLLNELTSLYIILCSHFNPVIKWRDRKFRLRWGGHVHEIHAKQTV